MGRHMLVAAVVIAVGIAGSWLALVVSWSRSVAGHTDMLE